MSEPSRWSNPEHRWLLLLHALFAVTLTVPTVLTVLEEEAPLSARLGTAAIAACAGAWYAWFARDPQHLERRGAALLHAGGLLVFAALLLTRADGYFLLIYSLLPLFFSTLPRALAVVGTVVLVALPVTLDGGVRALLGDRGALFNLLATVGLGLAITAVIDALGRTTERQQRTIAELEAARSEIAQLLERTRDDLRARDALARTGHALIAARTPAAVCAALATELAGHRMGVRGVALLARRHDDPARAVVLEAVAGTAAPTPGRTVRLPRTTADRDVALLTAAEVAAAGEDPGDGVGAVALLTLHTHTASRSPDAADLLWLSLGDTEHDEATLRDLSTVATATALAASNLHLAADAAAQGRAAGILAERQRLAHEIHDTLAQGFTSIVTQLEAAEQVLPEDRDAARRHLDRARRTARESLDEARRTVEALRPGVLDQAPLAAALRTVIERWHDGLDDDIEVTLGVTGAPASAAADADVDAALLRVAQEALTNVARHARASRVDVTLSYLDDLVLLDIQDDGVGFTVDGRATGSRATGSVATGGYGLLSMRERLQGVGGELVVESAPGDGTTIAARLALPAPLAPPVHDTGQE